MTNFDLVQSWYKRVWEDGDLDTINKFFHSEAEETGLVPDLNVNPNELRDLIEALMELVEDLRFELHLICEHGPWVTATVTARARAVDGGMPIEASGMVAVEVKDGKFLQAINSFNFMKLFEDLGHLPPGVQLACLTGTRLT